MRKLTMAEWLSKCLVTEAGCWEWTGQRNTTNYGLVARHVGFPSSWEKKVTLAHRESWEFHRGPIPDGLLVLHRCDNPPCINPDHLFLGTHRENIRDAADKGRMKYMRGAAHKRAKLTDEKVLEMARALVAGRGKAEVSRYFGVSVSLVRWIASGHRWRHVTEGIVDHIEAKCGQCRQRSRRGLRNPQGFVAAVPLVGCAPGL